MRSLTGVAVEEEDGGCVLGLRLEDEPPVRARAVGRLDPHLLEVIPETATC
jgi:hypothetical protein